MKLRALTILHAEDDPNDVLLLQRAVDKLGVVHRFSHVGDGEEAIDYLRGEGQFANREKFPFPNMLIVDLKMPRKGGLDVLKWLYDHTECSVIPCIVLTSSAQADDIKKSYQTAANAYFTKPTGLEEWRHLLTVIFEYWKLAHVPDPPPQRACE